MLKGEVLQQEAITATMQLIKLLPSQIFQDLL